MTETAELVGYHPKVARALRHLADPPPAYTIRPDTSDWKACREVWERNAYARHGLMPRPGQTWLDAGSNVGAFADLAARAGASVVAYEPEPTNAELVSLNTAGRPVELVRAALMADEDCHDGAVVLHVNSTPLGLRRHSTIKARRASTPVTVAAHGIGAVMDRHRPHGAKLNIEGAEIRALQTWTPPQFLHELVFEWSFDVDARLAVLAQVLTRLEARYPHVAVSRRIPWNLEAWPPNYFPPQCYVYCSDGTAS